MYLKKYSKFYLEIFWDCLHLITLVEVFWVERRSHLQHLNIVLQFLGDFRSLHVKPISAIGLLAFFL